MSAKTVECNGYIVESGRIGIHGEYFGSVQQPDVSMFNVVHTTGRYRGKGARDKALAAALAWAKNPPPAPSCHRCGKPVHKEKVSVAKVGVFHHTCWRQHKCGVPL